MILQALYEYYQRKAADPDSGIAPEGFVGKKIDFVVVLTADGSYVRVDSLQQPKGKKFEGKEFFVPEIGKQSEKHANAGNDANLLWDNSGFVFGIGNNAEKKRISFLETILKYYPYPPNDVQAVINFLSAQYSKDKPFEQLINHQEYSESIISGQPNITFRIDGQSRIITEEEHVKEALLDFKSNDEIVGNCLVTGDSSVPIEPNHMVTKRVIGAQTSGANLVSFNSDAFCSYKKKQSANAPVSKSAATAYTKALQYLVDSGKNRFRFADATFVFWSQKHDYFEEVFPAFFQFPQKDNPDADVQAVKALYDGVFTGSISTDSDKRFYVLGVSPNAARISVRFWHQGPISEFAGKIQQHFDDLEIIRSPKDTGRYSLFWILSAMAVENKVDNIPPNLAGQIFQSVITGIPYPITMLQQTIRRVRATQNVTRLQAGVLKAYINRFYRIHSTKEKEIAVALDPENMNPGYRLGRLFAVLEKIQEEANPGINTTIRDRFYGAASSTPITVFPQLLKLKNHHLSKLKSVGRKVNFEKLLGEIIDGIPPDMPPYLTMEDQARFAVGYYHQRRDLF